MPPPLHFHKTVSNDRGRFFCSLDYDPFQFLADNNKTYGFTINIFDNPQSIATLWPETMSFLNAHPDYLAADNSMSWLTDRTLRPDHTEAANGYSTCHFWSNFEIADMTFWRSPQYQEYFEHLDRAGGFFYERWGDAPVHSIALGLFEDNSRIHWYALSYLSNSQILMVLHPNLGCCRFRDIGYQHPPYINCPDTPNCSKCQPNIFTHSWGVMKEDCRINWFKQMCESRRRHGTLDNNITPDEEEICRQLDPS
jgi:mannosyltransferase